MATKKQPQTVVRNTSVSKHGANSAVDSVKRSSSRRYDSQLLFKSQNMEATSTVNSALGMIKSDEKSPTLS